MVPKRMQTGEFLTKNVNRDKKPPGVVFQGRKAIFCGQIIASELTASGCGHTLAGADISSLAIEQKGKEIMNRKHWLMLTAFLLCLVGPAVLAYDSGSSEIPTFKKPNLESETPYEVTRVVDGNTFVVSKGAESATVRLIGIDTLKAGHPTKAIQYYGRETSRFLRNFLKGERVYLLLDSQSGKLDKYGRTLAYIYRYPDGLFVNAEIIRQGYGRAGSEAPFEHMEKFGQLERFARNARKGLWGKVLPSEASETETKNLRKAKAPALKPAPTEILPKMTVYVTSTGRREYHRSGCKYLRASRIPISLKKAKAEGYTRCKECRPPM